MKHSTHSLARLLLSAVALSLAIPSADAAAQFTAEQLKCRSDISKNTAKLVKTVEKTIAGCHKNRIKGKVGVMNDCNDLAAPETDPKNKVGKAEGKLIDKVAGPKSKCLSESPATLRYYQCPAPCNGVVPALSTMADLADCLVCLAEDEAMAMLASSQGAPAPPLSKDDGKCHSTIGKEQSKLVDTLLKERTKCQNAAEKAGATDLSACANQDPNGKISSTRTKGEAKIAGACGAANLVAVDSCATTDTIDLNLCVFDDAETRGETLFEAMYELGDPTWAAVQGLFLANGCASNFCHGNAPGSGNLGDLGNYDLAYDEMLVEGVFCLPTGFTQRVVANDVANSFLVAKLEGTQDCGLSMPLGGMLLDPAIIDVVKAWINSGALKN